MKNSANAQESRKIYDLVVKGARILDPAQGLDARMDLAVSRGRVAAIAEQISATKAQATLNIQNKILVPGLVDIHQHCYWGATSMGVDVAEACLKRGVTTVVDAGSSGTSGFDGLRKWILSDTRCRVLAFLNLSAMGLVIAGKAPEFPSMEVADPQGATSILKDHPDTVLGLKIRLSDYAVVGSCLAYLKMGREVADAARTRLMVHIGDTVETLPEILQFLRPGDIVSHILTPRPHGILDENNRILPQVWEAAKAGVVMDAAHGRFHFGFAVAERALDQGFLPATISSDLTVQSISGPVVDLLTTMDKFLSIGLPLPEVVARVTSAPATALGKTGEFGDLKPGAQADFTVLTFEEGVFSLTDAAGETRQISQRLKAVAVARAGEVMMLD